MAAIQVPECMVWFRLQHYRLETVIQANSLPLGLKGRYHTMTLGTQTYYNVKIGRNDKSCKTRVPSCSHPGVDRNMISERTKIQDSSSSRYYQSIGKNPQIGLGLTGFEFGLIWEPSLSSATGAWDVPIHYQWGGTVGPSLERRRSRGCGI